MIYDDDGDDSKDDFSGIDQATLDAVAKSHPNLMAQEMLRDIARIAKASVKNDTFKEKSSSSGSLTLETGQKEIKRSSPNLKTPAVNGGVRSGGQSKVIEEQMRSKFIPTSGPPVAEMMVRIPPGMHGHVPNQTMKLPLQVASMPVPMTADAIEVSSIRNVKTEGAEMAYLAQRRPESALTVEPVPVEVERGAPRKSRKGTPVKLCATPPSSGLDLSNVRRQICSESLDIGYDEDLDETSQPLSEPDIEVSSASNEPISMNIGTMRVPIRPIHKETMHSRKSLSNGTKSMSKSPPRMSGGGGEPNLLDLTGSGRNSTTDRQDIMAAVAESNIMKTMDRVQTLLLNGKDYEIVPIGNGRWITRNEYELLKELCTVDKILPVSSHMSVPKSCLVKDNVEVENMSSDIPISDSSKVSGGAESSPIEIDDSGDLPNQKWCSNMEAAASPKVTSEVAMETQEGGKESDQSKASDYRNAGDKEAAETDHSGESADSSQGQKHKIDDNEEEEEEVKQNGSPKRRKSGENENEKTDPEKENNPALEYESNNAENSGKVKQVETDKSVEGKEDGSKDENDSAILKEGDPGFPLLKELLKPPHAV